MRSFCNKSVVLQWEKLRWCQHLACSNLLPVVLTVHLQLVWCLASRCMHMLTSTHALQAPSQARQPNRLPPVALCAPGGSNNSRYDFTSRFFAPWAGIPEDPVTGSAHCVLGPFWASRLGKTRLRARQCSARGGDLWVTVDEAAGRVELAGHAVLVMNGHLLLPKEAL